MVSASQETQWMALWLPHLPTDRVRRAGGAPPDGQPFAIYAQSGNGFTLRALDARAVAAGLVVGMTLADAQAMHRDLLVQAADEAADGRLLDQVAAWCERFTPIVVRDPPDGLFLNISGCAHLFGGAAALLGEVTARVAARDMAVRAAIAPTAAAAWALAHFAGLPSLGVTTGPDLRAALAALPIAALRLRPDAAALLKRLGLTRIGQIIDAPRAPFTARAGLDAMRRLDQALGRVPEALTPYRPPPPVFALSRLAEPVLTLDAILALVEQLCTELAGRLDHVASGARRVRLSLFAVDGGTRRIELGLTQPVRDPAILLRLLRERLRAIAERLDAEFGFEAARLDATEIAAIVPHMGATHMGDPPARDAVAEARLIDTLVARLGTHCVGRLAVRDVHAPERASLWVSPEPISVAVAGGSAGRVAHDNIMRRPLHLLDRAQPIEVIALVPDGPPLRFHWRGVPHEVVRAEGPERITANWLRAPDARLRDYYRIEDKQGHRYWLYREGLYGEAAAPRWFLHGLFA